jgi:hypothetical protein
MLQSYVQLAAGPLSTRRVAMLAVSLGFLAMACSAPSASPSATATQGPASTATSAVNPQPPAPGGATTFHMVISDGPKAGTYDVSTTNPLACSVADVGYFGASYLETANPGLDYIDASLHPGNVTGLTYFFDAETETKIQFVGDGTVTVEVDDRGSTATMRVVSESNIGTQADAPTVIHTGRTELTVECASVLRPG